MNKFAVNIAIAFEFVTSTLVQSAFQNFPVHFTNDELIEKLNITFVMKHWRNRHSLGNIHFQDSFDILGIISFDYNSDQMVKEDHLRAK